MPESKGHLNPGSPGLSFDRFELGPGLPDLVRHVWVPRWVVPDGEVLPQRTDPGKLVDSSEPLTTAPVERVRQVMTASAGYRRGDLVGVLRAWLLPFADRLDHRGRLVNEACRMAEEDPDLTRAADLAARVGLSPRALERLVRSHIGLTPKWLIECRRLQEAATSLFGAPDTDLSVLAANLGYTDYPHFYRRYQRVLGESPRETRDRGAAARAWRGRQTNGVLGGVSNS